MAPLPDRTSQMINTGVPTDGLPARSVNVLIDFDDETQYTLDLYARDRPTERSQRHDKTLNMTDFDRNNNMIAHKMRTKVNSKQ